MGYFAIFALCFASLVSSGVHAGFNHSVGPIAVCKKDMLDSRAYVESCFQRCQRPERPSGHGILEIFSAPQNKKGPTVIHCTKVRLSQTFTETWSFSQFSGPLEKALLPLSIKECQDAVREKCPNWNCNVRSPGQLEEEYHYASETTVTKDYLNLVSVPSGLTFYDTEIKVIPMESSASFNLSAEVGTEKDSVYLWKSSEVTSCPYESAVSVGCDVYNGTVDSYVCRGSRISVEGISRVKQLKGLCSDVSRAPSGLLIKFTAKELTSDRADRKVFLTQSASETTIETSLRTQTGDALSVIDEDLCQLQCEILEMNSRLNLGRESLMRLGNRYVLQSKTGFIRECDPLVSCAVTTPHLYCGSPVRVSVSCDERHWMWNPMKSYVEESGVCHAVERHEKLHMLLGSHIYDVGDDLSIQINQSDNVGLPHDLLNIRASTVKMETFDPEALKRSWAYELNNPRVISQYGNISRNINHWDVMNEMTTGFGRVMRTIGDVFHKTYLFAGIIITLVLVFWGYDIIVKRGWVRNYRRVARSPNRQEPTGEAIWM